MKFRDLGDYENPLRKKLVALKAVRECVVISIAWIGKLQA